MLAVQTNRRWIEVSLIWNKRVVNTYHFPRPGFVPIDFGPIKEIAIPFDLKDDEVLVLDLGFELTAQVRFVENEDQPIVASFFDLNQQEREGLITTIALSAILALYLFVFPFKEVGEAIDLPNANQRKVTFLYTKPSEPSPLLEEILKPIQAPKNISTPSKNKIKQSSGLLDALAEIGRATERASRTSNQVRALGTGASGSSTRNDSKNLDGIGTKSSGPGGFGENTVGLPGGIRTGKIYGSTGPGLGTKTGLNLKMGGQGEFFQGSIDKEGIRRVVKDHQQEVQACYERALNQSPGLSGKIVMEWEILGQGRVGKVRIQSSSVGNRGVADCMAKALKGWIFPEPPSDQIAVVAFPFVFLPLE